MNVQNQSDVKENVVWLPIRNKYSPEEFKWHRQSYTCKCIRSVSLGKFLSDVAHIYEDKVIYIDVQ